MPQTLKTKCTNCGRHFSFEQKDAELVDDPSSPPFFKIECPFCGRTNNMNIEKSTTAEKRMMYKAGGIFFYVVTFAVFLGTTPQGWFSTLVLVGSFVILLEEGLLWIFLPVLVLAMAVFLYNQWRKGDVNIADYVEN